jgi:hypothetical protein
LWERPLQARSRAISCRVAVTDGVEIAGRQAKLAQLGELVEAKIRIVGAVAVRETGTAVLQAPVELGGW